MEKKIILNKSQLEKCLNLESKREHIEKLNLNDNDLSYFKQIEYLNMFYLDNEFTYKSLVNKEIKKKINCYKKQDITKKIFNEKEFINTDEILNKLVSSKLKCYYCLKELKLIYTEVREKLQWTLDRINNDIGHTEKNTVICCLDCNIKKKRMDDEKFKFSKQVCKIKKI